MSLAYSTTQQLKDLPIDEVYRRYLGGDLRRRGSRFYSRCPWHGGSGGDKNPSLVLYPGSNSWHCFGCGTGGDIIDIVKRALNVDFKDAIRIMAADFGIALPGSTQEEQAEAWRIGLKAKFKRELEARFKVKENEAHQKLAALYRTIDSKLANIRTLEDLDRFGNLHHIKTQLEHVLEVLRTGAPADRFAVLKDEKVRRWCGWP